MYRSCGVTYVTICMMVMMVVCVTGMEVEKTRFETPNYVERLPAEKKVHDSLPGASSPMLRRNEGRSEAQEDEEDRELIKRSPTTTSVAEGTRFREMDAETHHEPVSHSEIPHSESVHHEATPIRPDEAKATDELSRRVEELKQKAIDAQERFMQVQHKVKHMQGVRSTAKVGVKAGMRFMANRMAVSAKAKGGTKMNEQVMKGLGGARPEDIEDCVACRFAWLGVEQEVGNDQIEENVYDAFTQNCIEMQKAPIFYPACEDMFDDIYGMIGDYMDGYTVNQLCEGARMCR